MPDILIAADSIRSPEMRHEVPVPVPDPFTYFEHDGKRYVLVSSFEVPRIQERAPEIELLVPEQFGLDELLEQGYKEWRLSCEIAARACKEVGLAEAAVPPTFPSVLLDHLRANGIALTVDEELFTRRRRVKTPAELDGIRRAQRACERAMDAARDLMRRAERRNGSLILDGEPLTCERIRAAVEDVFTASNVV